jgi:hypothetical protein
MNYTLQNAALTHYYRGWKIERKQNSSSYYINGMLTTFVTIEDVKNHIDRTVESLDKIKKINKKLSKQ